MKPLYLALKDFTNHGISEIDFTKLSSIALIVGMEDGSNDSSNGVGKTNIFNAIKYVLFNSKIFNAKEKIIRNGTDKCSVTFAFELSNGNIYKIERVRTKTTQAVKFYIKEDDWKDISAKTTSQTDELIIETIGINEETFENSSYLKQNDFKRRKVDTLASASPEEKKSIIIDMLQLGIWSKFEKRAKELRDDININLAKTKNMIDSIGDPETVIKDKKDNIIFLENEIISINKLINDNTLLLNDKTKVKLELNSSLSNDYPELDKKLKNSITELSKLNNEMVLLENQKKKLDDELKNNKIVLQIYKDRKIKEQNELEQLKEVNINKSLEIDLSNVLNEISKIKTSIRSDKSSVALFKKPMSDSELCPECGTELDNKTKEKGTQKKALYVKSLEENIAKDEEKLNKLILDKSLLEKQIADINQKLERINKLISSISKLDIDIPSNEEYITEKEKNINSYIQNIKSKQELKLSVEASIFDIKTKIAAINYETIENKIKIINLEISALEKELSLSKAKLSSSTLNLGQCKAVLEIKEKEKETLKVYEKEQKILNDKLLVYKAATSVFSSDGTPKMIIYSVLDALQNETNRILKILKSGLQLKFIINKENDKGIKSDTLDIVYYINGIENDFSLLSGGESGCVVLALKCAMANISRKRCGSDIKMLLIDESDQMMDRKTVDSFYEIMKELSKDMTILIITHNEKLQTKFNSFIMVKKENGVSRAGVIND